MKHYFLLLIPVLLSCSKDADTTPPEEAPAPVSVSYTVSISGSEHLKEITNDTLIVWLNDVITIKKIEASILDDYSVKGKTGDKVRIRYNPGKQYYPHYNSQTQLWEDYIPGPNSVHIYFSSKYADVNYSCKCVTDYSLTL